MAPESAGAIPGALDLLIRRAISQERWRAILAPYEGADVRRSLLQLAVTLVLYGAAWAAMLRSVEVGYLATAISESATCAATRPLRPHRRVGARSPPAAAARSVPARSRARVARQAGTRLDSSALAAARAKPITTARRSSANVSRTPMSLTSDTCW